MNRSLISSVVFAALVSSANKRLDMMQMMMDQQGVMAGSKGAPSAAPK